MEGAVGGAHPTQTPSLSRTRRVLRTAAHSPETARLERFERIQASYQVSCPSGRTDLSPSPAFSSVLAAGGTRGTDVTCRRIASSSPILRAMSQTFSMN
jgi:hypothetical protein